MADTPDDSGAIARMRAVTVSREYGSGGGEIASRLAARIGWQLVDREVVAQVAQDLDISLDEARARDERGEGLIERIILSMQNMEAPVIAVPTDEQPLDSQTFAQALRRVIAGAAATGHVVIVGRGGQEILRDQRDVLHLRVVCPLEQRISYVAQREGLSRDAAHRRIQQQDRTREQYIQSFHHCRVDDAHLYDFIINTAVLDLESCVALARTTLLFKARRLDVPEAELGPGAGLARYPGPTPNAPADSPAPRT